MINNTLQTISSQISPILDKSGLFRSFVNSAFDFLFEDSGNNIKKYLRYLGLVYLAKKSIAISKYFVSLGYQGIDYLKGRFSFDSAQFKDRFGLKYWTLILGADTEPGISFSKELAGLGLDVVLVGVNEKVINEVARQSQQINPYIKIKIIIVQKLYKNALDKIQGQTDTLDIGLLINNSQSFAYQKYETLQKQNLINGFNTNVNIIVDICKVFVEKMKLRPYKSGIINISSAFGVIPTPNTGVFSATSFYTDIMSRSLSNEFKDRIQVLSLRMLSVFQNDLKTSKVINHYNYVISALKALGNQDVTYGTFNHQINVFNRLHQCQKQSMDKILKQVEKVIENQSKA